MARIAGVDLPRNKRSFIALTYIYGIGQPRATRILDQANVDPMKKVQDLGEDEVNRIRQVIEGEGLVEGDLRKEVQMSIKRLIEIGSYRALMPLIELPPGTKGHLTIVYRPWWLVWGGTIAGATFAAMLGCAVLAAMARRSA